jgi:hypothetical protein
LKLNHSGYSDLEISYSNLEGYEDNKIPVVVDYRKTTENKNPEATSVFDNELEDGVEKGPCPFVVHGIAADKLDTKTTRELKAIALKHLNNGGKVLAVGRADKPESMYDNPSLYPQMFPWLFPYGHGGLDPKVLAENIHKRWLLMYYDKRFQKDPHFPLIAFNQSQVKDCSKGAFITANRNSFSSLANRLLNVNTSILQSLAEKLAKGEFLGERSEEEMRCFQILNDLDAIGSHVPGSISSKKLMRNNLWSLISFKGAPTWYITISPADIKHPICLYYADTKTKFEPTLRDKGDCFRLIASNPVAGARFFHFMIKNFIKHVLGVGTDLEGVYGKTAAYYGTVEQQGRLTLHLHLLLWVQGSLSPQEIRDKIMNSDQQFQASIVSYLEGCQKGEFLTGSLESVKQRVEKAQASPDYRDPTKTLPLSPPPECSEHHSGNVDSCKECVRVKDWNKQYEETVDDLLLKSNIHTCGDWSTLKNGKENMNYKGCMANKYGKCKARFPRETFEETEVDPLSGSMNLKKRESMMNTVTPVLTYLTRCNTDVTSMLSGTAIKAVVAYVSDYITKPSLKTYAIFDVIRSVFERNSEMLGGTLSQQEKAKKLMTQMVNSLTAKMEIGAPMASLYLLGNPDHYSSHRFVPFYWKIFVGIVQKCWNGEVEGGWEERVVVTKSKEKIVGVSPAQDYIHRPSEYENVCLYDWVRLYRKDRIRRKRAIRGGTQKEGGIIKELPSKNLNFQSKTIIPQRFLKNKVSNNPRSVIPDNWDEVSAEEMGWEEERLESDQEDDQEAECETESKSLWSKFEIDHPQHETHHARLVQDSFELVPDFKGGPLPRADKGDREFYCCTMLTLFKPWRTGKELRDESGNWDKAFEEYQFSDRQKELMKNFNIRYECLDAKDDFAAQRKSEEKEGLGFKWANNETLQDIEDLGYLPPDTYLSDEIGPKTLRANMKMMEMENLMTSLNWQEPRPAQKLDSIGVEEEGTWVPDRNKPPKHWNDEVKKAKDEVLRKRNEHAPSNRSRTNRASLNDVKVVDRSYLDKVCSHSNQVELETVISQFQLNEEQERAFRIVANHASMPTSTEPLKMYLGGMGGTGKTQVLKAISDFFEKRNEAHRFIVLAPTGSAAALLGGSTYHSVLRIRDRLDGSGPSPQEYATIKNKLEKVDYIFLDEVSMVSCHQFFMLGSRIANAMNEPNEPFGGVSAIFAGDFAQLPPVCGGESISLYGKAALSRHARMSIRDQESVIGKALWHQVTTVVILRQNMRQRSQTPEDAKLRTALENMRYKSCTSDDIAFLKTLVTGSSPGCPDITSERFRNIPIITAWNCHKDKLNAMGTERFAAETGQNLVEFYSIDSLKAYDSVQRKNPAKRTEAEKNIRNLTFQMREELWELPTSATDSQVPGKLRLCKGMPVIIRINAATEICITKGQDAVVVDWIDEEIDEDHKALKVLFVKLVNPPQSVQIPGLPVNVVPLTRDSVPHHCTLRNDAGIDINRSQVQVIPNFALTDYASQGKTRINNVVDLENCQTHQAYYVCLSRSASAAGTAILRGFSPSKITGGLSGYLRQEFRELELLDEITKLHYNKKLPESVNAHTRNLLIKQYRDWKGEAYVPSSLHPALVWTKSNPFIEPSTYEPVPWENLQPEKGVTKSKKRKAEGNEEDPRGKKQKVNHQQNSSKRKADDKDNCGQSSQRPFKRARSGSHSGYKNLEWDQENWSCAYDSLFVILYHIFLTHTERFIESGQHIRNKHLQMLAENFKKVQSNQVSFENARDSVRKQLHREQPTRFPYGKKPAAVYDVAHATLTTNETAGLSEIVCENCGFSFQSIGDNFKCVIDNVMPQSSQSAIDKFEMSDARSSCVRCSNPAKRKRTFAPFSSFIVLDASNASIELTPQIQVSVENGKCEYKLRGIVYYGSLHFTARMFTDDNTVLYHDGIGTYGRIVEDNTVDINSSQQLQVCGSQQVALAVYTTI